MVYTGHWEKWQLDGVGSAMYANGDSYEGNWTLGVWDGLGKLKCADGSIQEGNFNKRKYEFQE